MLKEQVPLEQRGRREATANGYQSPSREKAHVLNAHNRMERFWPDFQLALKSRDSSRVAKLTSFPLKDFDYDGVAENGTRDEFDRAFGSVFNEEAIRTLLAMPLNELKRGADGEWHAEWNNGLTSEGQLSITYCFARRHGRYRLVRIELAG